MSCADDLTLDDITESSTQILERVSAGGGAHTNLWGQIDRDNVTGLNLDDPLSASKVIKEWEGRLDEAEYVESGVDDDLIIHIPFTQSLRALALYLLPPPPSHPLRPTTLKIYINLTHCPGFEELDGMRALMDINIATPPRVARTAEGLRDVEEWGLKVQKMANVHSITLAFSESVGGNRSKLFYVGFKGEVKNSSMDMSQLGRVQAAGTADSQVDGVADKKGSGYTTIH